MLQKPLFDHEQGFLYCAFVTLGIYKIIYN